MNGLQELPPGPESHFRVHLYGALAHLRARLPQIQEVEFVKAYLDELTATGFAGGGDPAAWWAGVAGWEERIDGHLPIRALHEAADLGPAELTALFIVGLPIEDARFGVLFEALAVAGAPRRPSAGLVTAWDAMFRPALRRLMQLGLVEAADDALAPSERGLEVPAPLWEALRGQREAEPAPWARLTEAEALPDRPELILAPGLKRALEVLPRLLDGHGSRALVLRGAPGSGRGTVAGAVARALGRGRLEVTDVAAAGRLLGPLATALHAMPLMRLQPAPGETLQVPALAACPAPVAIATGRRGGLAGPGVDGATVVELTVPAAAERARHWRAALGTAPAGVAEAQRLTGGTIRRLAAGARAEAALGGREYVVAADVRRAGRAMQGAQLETLATRLPDDAGWEALAVPEPTRRELDLLELRCRRREQLDDDPGVRALFTGASGTGKTLAARLLGSALGKDVYALDLSRVVDKYLGETEKNLETAFSRAEELDVVLLLDEGDALMTQRTDVRTSNDRYANLETSFLLQRLESYEGILLITTNARERIDAAFRRRIDVVIDFPLPDPIDRWNLWRIHLPAEHLVSGAFLDELAARCELTGGQVRNAVLHARLLALEGPAPVGDRDLDAAVRREYDKSGAVCPLRERAHA